MTNDYEKLTAETDAAWDDYTRNPSESNWQLYCEARAAELKLRGMPEWVKKLADEIEDAFDVGTCSQSQLWPLDDLELARFIWEKYIAILNENDLTYL